jgi:hypothetical protein
MASQLIGSAESKTYMLMIVDGVQHAQYPYTPTCLGQTVNSVYFVGAVSPLPALGGPPVSQS